MGECKIPYKGKAFESYDALTSNLDSYQNYFVYRAIVQGNVFYFYINSKGFLHILKADRVSYHVNNSKTMHLFEVSDYLLTKSNTFKYKGKIGNYHSSIRDVNSAIFNMLCKDIRKLDM